MHWHPSVQAASPQHPNRMETWVRGSKFNVMDSGRPSPKEFSKLSVFRVVAQESPAHPPILAHRQTSGGIEGPVRSHGGNSYMSGPLGRHSWEPGTGAGSPGLSPEPSTLPPTWGRARLLKTGPPIFDTNQVRAAEGLVGGVGPPTTWTPMQSGQAEM